MEKQTNTDNSRISEIIETVVKAINDTVDSLEEGTDLWQQTYSDCLFAVSEYGSEGTEYVNKLFSESDPVKIADLLGMIKKKER